MEEGQHSPGQTSGGLDRSLVRGIAWTGGVKWITQFVSWSVTLVMAHLLSPGDYGLFGMAMVYLGLAQLAAEAGLIAVIIRPRELDRAQAAQLGGLAIMTGVAACAVSIAMSSLIALFFRDARVSNLIVVLSATFIVRGAQMLPRGLLSRDLDFRRLAWLDAVESLGSALATVTLAFLGFGYWSLVFGGLIGSVLATVVCFVMRPHAITFPRKFAAVAGSLAFGGHVVLSQFAWYIYSNADFAVVGRMLGGAALGAYTLAWTIANVPVDRVSGLVGRVTAPVFAAVQHDLVALRRYVCSLTEGLALVTVPACVGLAVVADVLVRALLGNKWEGAIVPLRLLSLYAAFRCVTALLSQVLIFTGHAKRNMQFSVLAAAVLPVCFVIAARWGTTGVAAVWISVYPALVGACYVYTALGIVEMPLRTYLRSLASALTGTAVMVAVLELLRWTLPSTLPPLVLLAILVTTGGAAYLALVFALHGDRLRVVFGMLRGQPLPAASSNDAPPPGPVPHAGPRILLVSWHFPPDPAVGALRWQKFTRYAAERGWGVDVLMRDMNGVPGGDADRLGDLPAGTRIFTIPERGMWIERMAGGVARVARAWSRRMPALQHGLSPGHQSVPRSQIGRPRSVRDIVRAWLAFVEHRRGVRWAAAATRVARPLADPSVHLAIVSCGPPHFVHRAAASIARDTGLPFVMDMRDPWSLIQRLPEPLASPMSLVLAARGERRAVTRASLVVMNTEPARDAMRLHYPGAAERIIAVPNGHDDDPVPVLDRDPRFVVAYAGTIYLDRNPRALFRAAAEFVRRTGVSPEAFSVEFMGDVASLDGVALEQIALEEGVGEFVRIHAAVPRREALEFLARASMLVVLPQDSDMAIPAKVFEYMCFPAWLLVFAAPASATAQLLDGVDAHVIAPDDVAGIASVLEARFRDHVRGVQATPLAAHAYLGRRARAAELFGALEAISDAHSSRTVASRAMIIPITKYRYGA